MVSLRSPDLTLQVGPETAQQLFEEHMSQLKASMPTKPEERPSLVRGKGQEAGGRDKGQEAGGRDKGQQPHLGQQRGEDVKAREERERDLKDRQQQLDQRHQHHHPQQQLPQLPRRLSGSGSQGRDRDKGQAREAGRGEGGRGEGGKVAGRADRDEPGDKGKVDKDKDAGGGGEKDRKRKSLHTSRFARVIVGGHIGRWAGSFPQNAFSLHITYNRQLSSTKAIFYRM